MSTRPIDLESMSPGSETLKYFNRERVRDYLETHLGATQKECAAALGLAQKTVQLHFTAIRNEWRKRGCD